MFRTRELALESMVTDALCGRGYVTVAPELFDRSSVLFPSIALQFIQATQPVDWSRLADLHGERTGQRVLRDLCKWMDTHGSLNTLRHGFKCYGRTLRIAYFKPAHHMNPHLEARYHANILGVTRQLHYSTRDPGKSVDLALSVNGVPVVTVELKNPLSGQTADDAMKQYRQDRDPRESIFAFKHRTLVHFAADTELVYMTTRLAGSGTSFLPFNRGNAGGAGNPPDPRGDSYRTAYLWEEVLARDSLLDLLARFLHIQVDEQITEDGRKAKRETMIFPRFHQLRAVRELAAAAIEGAGHNYLVEHSAGSGKSNTIAWLAHRLASLHTSDDQRVFDSVVVITDRLVLDKQLQETIYQFEHRQGVVQKIDEDSRQLARALEVGVPIIITTLQKFPFVSRQLRELAKERGLAGTGRLPTRKYAVIIDEAHSSQSGETAMELRGVLGGEALEEEARRRAAAEETPEFEELFRAMAKRGRQPNVSFFAFTATPKYRTLAMFGRNRQSSQQYTMRQAIEEGFIMDVLLNYATYRTYYKLLKDSSTDPEVHRQKAALALARFMRLHPHNISQKTVVMVEHFNNMTRHKIGGRAKAMVVTGSRLEAVRYKQSFDRYIRLRGYPIRSLVAFSGQVNDDQLTGVTYTEEQLNGGLRERDLPEKFATSEYQVLLVAEKYQTGYDQPLLHTMYIDKRLAGIQAVQTLSRLNRTHPLKEDTFVLDFVNDSEEIRDAFRQYYEGAQMADAIDPDRLYEIKSELDASAVYYEDEVERFAVLFFQPVTRQSVHDHQLMNATLDPAVDRFRILLASEPEDAELWRGKLFAFRNLYSFLSQIIPYQDSDLERLYVFLRHLASKLPKQSSISMYHFDDDVRLEYYRLQKISEGSISIKQENTLPLRGPDGVGTAAVHEKAVPLSRLVDVINERFGTDFNEADQLFFDQIVEAAVGVDSLQQAASSNPLDRFRLVFRRTLESLFVERMDLNEEIFARFMNQSDFHELVAEDLARRVYERLPSQKGQLEELG